MNLTTPDMELNILLKKKIKEEVKEKESKIYPQVIAKQVRGSEETSIEKKSH